MNYPPVYVLRHGQTLWNAEGRLQGAFDSSLTKLGREQAGQQHSILKSLDLSDVRAFSSPQGRAFHTASIALDGLVPTIETDSRLREIGVGAWQGKRMDEVTIDAPLDESDESGLDIYERAPGGEGFGALRARCASFLDDLQGPTVIVTHGITSRMLRLVLLDQDISEIGRLPGGQGVVYHLNGGVQRKLTIGA